MNNTPHETNALASIHQMTAPAPTMSSANMMMDTNAMDKLVRVAELMASGKTTIPQHLRGSAGDCLAVVMQAAQWNMNPFAVAQKTHLVNGTLGYEAQLVAAVINNSGVVKDRFNFEWFGAWEKVIGKFQIKRGEKGEYRVPGWQMSDEDGLGIKVWATVKGESEPRVLSLLLAQARTRNSTLWADDPKQQLAYLAQKRWARLYAPDVILGVYSPDELGDAPAPRDMGTANVVPTQDQSMSADLEAQARQAASLGMASFAKFYNSLDKTVRPQLRNIRPELDRIAAEYDAKRTVDTQATPAATQPTSTQSNTDTGSGEITMTYDALVKKLDAAKTEDALYVAMDWSSTLDDKSRMQELEDHFNTRLKAIRGE